MRGQRWDARSCMLGGPLTRFPQPVKCCLSGAGPDLQGGSFLTCPFHGSAFLVQRFSRTIGLSASPLVTNSDRNVDRSVVTERVQFVLVHGLVSQDCAYTVFICPKWSIQFRKLCRFLQFSPIWG